MRCGRGTPRRLARSGGCLGSNAPVRSSHLRCRALHFLAPDARELIVDEFRKRVRRGLQTLVSLTGHVGFAVSVDVKTFRVALLVVYGRQGTQGRMLDFRVRHVQRENAVAAGLPNPTLHLVGRVGRTFVMKLLTKS